MTLALRDYQQSAKDSIYEKWKVNRNVMAVLPTGAGKTFLFASIINDHQGAVCAIAHRQELVGQISMALARYGVSHKIIGPTSTVRFIISEHHRELGQSFYDPNSNVSVAGVDTLVRRTGQLAHYLQQVTMWVTDECFPAGTQVDGRNIEDIKIGDLVTSFDETTGEFSKQPVTHLFKNPMHDNMVRVESETHHVIESTKGHPYWTRRGWVNAVDLTTDDEVLIHEQNDIQRPTVYELSDNHSIINDNRKPEVSVQKNWKNFLPKIMWLFTPGRPENIHKESRVFDMFGLRIGLSKNKIARNQNVQHTLSVDQGISNDVEDKQEARTTTNDRQQPHAIIGESQENVRHTQEDRSSTEGQRGQRTRSNAGRKTTDQHVSGVWVRVANYCKDGLVGACQWLTEPLQNRLWVCNIEDSNRGRRVKSCEHQPSRTGQSQRQGAYWSRLASVQVFKPTDTDGTEERYVYNIEVDKFNTYVANNIVVHNCHHLLSENKWGKAVNLFPNARGLGVTATPSRADGKGLGRHTDGVMDVMVEGPTMRELINRGFLCEYRIFAPPSDLDMSSVTVSDKTGEYNAKKLKKAVQQSHLVGDVVQHYLRIAPGKQGVTFATDVETATDISRQFNDAGVKSEVVSAKTPDKIRSEIIRRFRNKELYQLVNVDLFGEGFDLPAIEVVSMARPTQSYGLYIQQFGRALRPSEGKQFGIIIDHAGNVVRHGLPDKPRLWSLDAREKTPKLKNPEDDIPLRYCVECTQPYERILTRCPYCGHYPVPSARDKPEHVDGDLTEMSPELLAEMRGEIARIQEPPEYVANKLERAGAPLAASRGAYSNHKKRQDAQAELCESIALWAGYQKHAGRSDSESYRLFYFLFKMDVLTAQTLGRPDAITLKGKLDGHIGELHGRTLQHNI